MRIAILGAGIGGLTTSLALYKSGLASLVFERTGEIQATGAGIMMQPNAMKVFQWLGIDDAIRSEGMEMNALEITNSLLQPFRRIKSLGDGNKVVAIHRARLQAILLSALPTGVVQLGKEYVDHTVAHPTVNLYFSDGTSQECHVLLAADGIHSKVRQKLFPQSRTRYAGQTCWRGVASMELPVEYRYQAKEAWGKRLRFGFAAIAPGEVYWYAVSKASQGGKDDPQYLKRYLADSFNTFHPLIPDIIAQTPINKIIRSDISDLRRLDSWHQGPVCLLGDAAHATTPNLGQGGCLAVEDAYYLSRSLAATSELHSAFFTFEQQRRHKVDSIVNLSWQLGQLAHSRFGPVVMKWAMKLTPQRLMQRQMQGMYKLEG